MSNYSVQLGISGQTALWSKPDTMPNPVSFVALTFSAAGGFTRMFGPRDTPVCLDESHTVPAFLEMMLDCQQAVLGD